MKKSLMILFVSILIISMIPFIQSAPPFIESSVDFPNGYVIVDNPQQIIKYNTSYQYNFFVFNSSNGFLIDNTSIACVFYLANFSGDVLYYDYAVYSSEGYWTTDLQGGNFTDLGYYGYGVKCNDSLQGGARVGLYEVTITGHDLQTSGATLALGIILSIILIGIFFGWLGLKLMEKEITSPIGLFFLLVSLILAVYGFYLGLIYSNYLIFAVSEVQSSIFIGVIYGLTGIIFISLLFLVLKTLKEIKERKSIQKYGTDYDTQTKQYKY